MRRRAEPLQACPSPQSARQAANETAQIQLKQPRLAAWGPPVAAPGSCCCRGRCCGLGSNFGAGVLKRCPRSQHHAFSLLVASLSHHVLASQPSRSFRPNFCFEQRSRQSLLTNNNNNSTTTGQPSPTAPRALPDSPSSRGTRPSHRIAAFTSHRVQTNKRPHSRANFPDPPSSIAFQQPNREIQEKTKNEDLQPRRRLSGSPLWPRRR